jgi:hypothetical protein
LLLAVVALVQTKKSGKVETRNFGILKGGAGNLSTLQTGQLYLYTAR